MAFEDYDEYEQGEQVRKWIKENGIAVAAGIVIALGGIFGWRQWQSHQANHELQAASQYAVVQRAATAGNQQSLNAALGDLQKNYANTTYAAFASAAVAEYHVGKNQLKPAAQALEWAVSHSRDAVIKSLFSLRLARVLLAEDQAQQALTTLDAIPAGDYPALASELRGDALLKLGKTDAARAAYQAALAKLEPDAPERNVVEMKLDNLTQPAAAPLESKAQ
jgi:predicted negative regulator of RcsB-dependent stress response